MNQRNPPTRVEPVKHCSRCGGTESTGRCMVCRMFFCVQCIDAHFTEDDPKFCPM